MRASHETPAAALFACVALMIAIAMVMPHMAAAERSRIPPLETYKAMLDGTRQSGWVAIAEQDGKQLLYFTGLLTLSCRLREIRFSINTRDLDERFPVMECDPQSPFSMPADFVIEELLIRLDAGSIESVAVQVVWEDGTEGPMQVYEPCDNVDGRACAWPVE